MEGDLIKINEWLQPFSWLYGIGVGLRNTLFDIGILESRQYPIPVINVGNITAGGTGKTPHVEYLIELLSQQYKVAVLSRGYKRKSSGYILAETDTPMERIGDEPWQIKQKFPSTYVAVDSNRRRGIEQLCNDPRTKDVDVILLDDAYQHRYVKPGLNILLIDYHRMITDDCLLPAGRLREKASARNRASMVIVTKCPHNITPMGFRVIQSSLQLKPYQNLFYSTFHYGTLKKLFGEDTITTDSLRVNDTHVLLVTGIGNPQQMEQDLRRYVQYITPLSFPDHHYFSASDIEKINTALAEIPRPRIIVTTEKDSTRLRGCTGLSEEARDNLYVLPIKIEILRNEANSLNEKITRYVLKNPRNSKLAKG